MSSYAAVVARAEKLASVHADARPVRTTRQLEASRVRHSDILKRDIAVPTYANPYPRGAAGPGEFDYYHAYNYVVRALRAGAGGNAKGAKSPPKSIRARRVSGQSATGHFDPTAVDDITQDAAVEWWASRANGRTPLDTRGATRFALKMWRRAQRKSAPVRTHCAECTDADRCADCAKRVAKDIQRWTLANRPTGFNKGIRAALDTVQAVPEASALDFAPVNRKPRRGGNWQDHAVTILKWVASGSSLTDTGKKVGMKPGRKLGFSHTYIRTILARLRTILGPDAFVRPEVSHERGRIFGDGSPGGCRGSGLSALLDIFDTMHGHAAPAASSERIIQIDPYTSESWRIECKCMDDYGNGEGI